MAFMGSGYTTTPEPTDEGQALFGLDVMTGDVVSALPVQDGSGTMNTLANPAVPLQNALVGPALVYQQARLASGFIGRSVIGVATGVYIGDLHGRVWKFTLPDEAQTGTLTGPILLHDFGDNQPIGTGMAALAFDSNSTGVKPHIYVTTGGDRRVAHPGNSQPFNQTPPFLMAGVRDDALSTTATSAAGTLLFDRALPILNNAPGYRGTVGPISGFNENLKARVFFTGTQFTPAGTACTSRFDTQIAQLAGVSGTPTRDPILFDNVLVLDMFVLYVDSGGKTIAKPMVAEGSDGGGIGDALTGAGGGGGTVALEEQRKPESPFSTVRALEIRTSSTVCRDEM
jgi:microcompartment protein CcmK/EutM